MNDDDMRYFTECYESLDKEKLAVVLPEVRAMLEEYPDGESNADLIRHLIADHGKHEWIHASNQHFGFGMWFRNWLRDHGYGEKYWPVDNLDDYYVGIIEGALEWD